MCDEQIVDGSGRGPVVVRAALAVLENNEGPAPRERGYATSKDLELATLDVNLHEADRPVRRNPADRSGGGAARCNRGC